MAKILLKLIRLEICALNIQLIHEVESPAFAISTIVMWYDYNNIFINGSCDNRYYVLKLSIVILDLHLTLKQEELLSILCHMQLA